MKYRDKLIFTLLACAFSSIVAIPERNETNTSTTVEADVDGDVYNLITAATLSNIAQEHSEEHSVDVGSKEAMLNVSKALLASSQELSEQKSNSANSTADSGANPDAASVEDAGDVENVDQDEQDRITSIETETEEQELELIEQKNTKEEDTKEIIENLFLGMKALPDNATPFELLKAQIQADFAPFLIIIPRPIKRMIASGAVKLGERLKIIVVGPLMPMVIVAGKVLRVVGNGVVYIGTDVVRFSEFLSAMGDVSPSAVKQNILEDGDSTLDIIESGSNDSVTGDGESDDDIASIEAIASLIDAEASPSDLEFLDALFDIGSHDSADSAARESTLLYSTNIELGGDSKTSSPSSPSFNVEYSTKDIATETDSSSIDTSIEDDSEYIDL